MKEYKTAMWPAEKVGFVARTPGKVDTEEFDRYLNAMAAAGWELHFTECLNGFQGTRAVLCIFVKESTAQAAEPS
jgi:hypothetical protein